MDAKASNKFAKICSFLLEAEPDYKIGSFIGKEYSIKCSLEQYELLEPFIDGFQTTEYQVGQLSFSTNERIFECAVLHHKDSQGNTTEIHLCFRDENDFYSAYENLENCFTTLIFGSRGISLETIQKQIKEG